MDTPFSKCMVEKILIKMFAKVEAFLLYLPAMLLIAVDAQAATFGTLEREGSSYKVLTSLRERPSNDSPFVTSSPVERRRWNFGWSDLQPGFPTDRFQCRNPERPVSCLDAKDLKLPLCSAFENLEDNFVRLAQTKSSYGDTPTERGVPSSWSKMSAGEKTATAVFGGPALVGAAVGVGAAVVLFSPVIAIGAMMHPECVGWNTKWVEFDHDAFSAKVREGLATKELDKSEARTQIEARFQFFSNARNRFSQDESSRLRAEMKAALQKAAPYEKLIDRSPRNTFPTPYAKFAAKIEDWKPETDSIEILPDYQALEQATSKQISTHYAAQRELVLAAANTHLQRVTEVAAEVTKVRFAAADTVQKMQLLQSDLQGFADPADLLPKVLERLAILQKAEESQRQAAEKQRVEQERKDELFRRENERKAEIALQSFRKALRVGVDTNCGPVVEIRPPMVKIAHAVSNYGTEHWLKISTIWPPGAGCRFYNGTYDPPR